MLLQCLVPYLVIVIILNSNLASISILSDFNKRTVYRNVKNNHTFNAQLLSRNAKIVQSLLKRCRVIAVNLIFKR